jgi:hypothetical protein
VHAVTAALFGATMARDGVGGNLRRRRLFLALMLAQVNTSALLKFVRMVLLAADFISRTQTLRALYAKSKCGENGSRRWENFFWGS